MQNLILILSLIFTLSLTAQEKSGAKLFWENIQKHYGNAYEGEIIAGGLPNDGFTGNRLVMHVRKSTDNLIKIPFFVGEDKSRTWVLRLENDRILLKHDHRHKDGTEDKVTQYGGWTNNSGTANLQMFPADQETYETIAYAASNVWWITIDDTSFTYNLRRIGSERVFSVKFDLTKKVDIPDAPWGWED